MNAEGNLLAEVMAERDRLRRGGAELGKSLKFWMDLAVDVTGSHDCIEDDGDGDWGAVAERLAELPYRIASAWDEGYAAGENMAHLWGHVDHWEDAPSNPYRGAPQDGAAR